MAISKMKRLSAAIMRYDAEQIIASLQKLRCIDVTCATDELTAFGFSELDSSEDIANISQKLSDATRALEFLSNYSDEKRPFFSSPDEISADNYGYDFLISVEEKVKRALELSDTLSECRTKYADIGGEIDALTPWISLKRSIPYSKSRCSISAAGILPPKIELSQLEDATGALPCVTEIIGKGESGSYAVVTSHRDCFDEILRRLGEFGFALCPVSATESDGYASGKLDALKKRGAEISEMLEKVQSEARILSLSMHDIEIYYDIRSSELARAEAAGKLSCSEKTVIITGWVPENRVDEVASLLDSSGSAYEFCDPTPDDDPPILFKNGRFVSQFEPVVELYSPPAYGSYDPTAVMSIFYIIIFGLMLADVGYGLLISAACLAALRIMKPRGSTKKMFTMFAMCGISCIIAGILFGGYFSDAPSVIMQNWFGIESPPEMALLFNPLTSPIPFLAVSLGVGAVHLITALALKFYITWSRGHKLDAICDQGSWIILFAGAGILFLYKPLGLSLICLGVLMLILTQGRSERNVFMKLFKGIASLYDIVNYLSDLLSYSRILALGLASMVVGSVFNILGALPGPSVVGVIFFTVIFALGHMLNIGVNLLGTFVHTSRLQYIEFFGKFYEDGGHMFEPLAPRSKYVIFK